MDAAMMPPIPEGFRLVTPSPQTDGGLPPIPAGFRLIDSGAGPPPPVAPVKIGAAGLQDTLRQTLKNTDWLTRNIAGAGTALSDLYQGGKQLVGLGDQQAIENNEVIKQEAPVGTLAGNVAAAAIPFGVAGNSIKAAAGVGAALGALQPVGGEQTAGNIVKGKVIDAALGGITAAGGQKLANAASGWLSNKIAENAAAMAAEKSRNAPIDATIKEAIDAGYRLPPGQINPTWINRRLESAAGKQATQQFFSQANSDLSDTLARRVAGLSPEEPITPETLAAARDRIQAPYADVAKIVGQDTLDQLDALRTEARNAWREYGRQGTRAALNDFKKNRDEAKGLENVIDSVLVDANRPDLMQQFRQARIDLAKNHDIETALIEGGGTIDPRAIARMTQRGDKLTGDLATIGKFANNFPKINQPDKIIGTPGAHNLPHVLGTLLAGGGFYGGGPIGALAGAAAGEAIGSAVPWAARRIMFSKPVQQGLIRTYEPSMTPVVLRDLLRYAPAASTVGSLYALPQ